MHYKCLVCLIQRGELQAWFTGTQPPEPGCLPARDSLHEGVVSLSGSVAERHRKWAEVGLPGCGFPSGCQWACFSLQHIE